MAKIHNNISAVYYRKNMLNIAQKHCLLALKYNSNYEKVKTRLQNIISKINNINY